MRSVLLILSLFGATSVAAQTTPVATQSFDQLAIYPQKEAFATVISLNDSRIAAEVTARIVDIPVEVGQVVPKGATLVRLDARDYVFKSDLLGSDETLHNFEFTGGLTVFF